MGNVQVSIFLLATEANWKQTFYNLPILSSHGSQKGGQISRYGSSLPSLPYFFVKSMGDNWKLCIYWSEISEDKIHFKKWNTRKPNAKIWTMKKVEAQNIFCIFSEKWIRTAIICNQLQRQITNCNKSQWIKAAQLQLSN